MDFVHRGREDILKITCLHEYAATDSRQPRANWNYLAAGQLFVLC
ncbi:hypothetical protein T08_14042 [Trichinella sp. T8]|nr:hypothetical protein T08_14042 [Trichinella sp. T8]